MNNEEKRAGLRGLSWNRYAAMIICIAAVALALYLGVKHLLKYALPFIVAVLISTIATGASARLKRHTSLSIKTLKVAVLLFLLASVSGILYFSAHRLTAELGRLADGLSRGEGVIYEAMEEAVGAIERICNRLASLLPMLGEGEVGVPSERLNELADSIISSVLTSASSAIPGILSSIISSMPSLFLGLAVTVIASFYLTLDGERIKSTIADMGGSAITEKLPQIKNEATQAAAKYLRAYSLIVLITFGEVFLGLSLLGVEYSFLIALVTAIIDVLPVLGVGTLLIPWAIVSMLTHNYFLGAGLLVLYVIVLVVRQIIEPKILGSSLGVHPLFMLAALYIGYQIAGFPGMLLAPLCLIAFRALRPTVGLGKS